MLRKLMWRDLVLNRWPLSLNGGLFVVWLGYFAYHTEGEKMFAILTALMMAFFPLTILTREDLAKASAAVCYLPVSRRDIVRARVLLSWLLMVGGTLVFFAFASLAPGSRVGGGGLFSPALLFLALGMLVVVAALMLPFTIRFGFMGLIAFLVAAQGAGILLLFTAGDRGSSLSPRAFAGMVTQGLEALRAQSGIVLFYFILTTVFGFISYLSYRLGLFLYQRREF